MIVVGSRGQDLFGRHSLGSVSSGLLHHAQCPVAVVHAPESAQEEIDGAGPVLLGIDDARRIAIDHTRQYAKRQMTWFRHQLTPDVVANPASLEKFLDKIEV